MIAQFPALFQSLTGNEPFPWQTELARRLLQGEIPSGCALPTGMGKTSIIPIWVICLGLQAMKGTIALPRRLVYAVNRRVIVDQATEEITRIVDILSLPNVDSRIARLREALAALSVAGAATPLAVSTLRGGLADNGTWKADPTQPAIIVGTVDMIGSKLLFCGYGDGRRDRPLHAGLLGQDVLLVHDESHLMPAFGQSLRQSLPLNRRGTPLRPFHTLDLSATGADHEGGNSLQLSADDYACLPIRRRLGLEGETGRKRLRFHDLTETQKVVVKFVECAIQHENTDAAVLIYVRTVGLARKIQDALRKALVSQGVQGENRLLILTGTLRGYERDQLASHPVLKRFNPQRNREPSKEGAVYLISTAAGEVGANYDADHCVCDLSTLDSMIQRLGRVNRLGLFPESRVDVVVDQENLAKQEGDKQPSGKKTKKDPLQPSQPLTRTLELLNTLAGDASVHNIAKIAGHREAYPPVPILLDLDEWTLDAWSVTGLDEADFPHRPEVALWLYGITEAERPETHVAWRFELDSFQTLEGADAGDWLQDYLDVLPLHRQELLKEPTHEVAKALETLAEQGQAQGATHKALLIKADGNLLWGTLEEISKIRLLNWGTVILPTVIGGLSAGLLDTSPKALRTAVADVADEPEKRERFLLRRQGEQWEWRQADGASGSITAAALPEAIQWLADERQLPLSAVLDFPTADPDHDEPETRQAIVIFSAPETRLPAAGDLSAFAKRAQRLDVHLDRTEDAARRIVAKLDLPTAIADAVCIAARWHDKGKDRPHWQKAIGNRTGDLLAKSGHTRFDRRFTKGYRHEFGSLLDAKADPVLRQHPERDLILHLMAAHHGYARPGFPERAYDRTVAYGRNEQSAQTVLNRFAALQTRFGWWSLAWLEALVKAADAMGGPND